MVTHQTGNDDRLLRALAEQLKLPLLQIARQAELSANAQQGEFHSIMQTANMALQLVDSYLLTGDHHAQTALQLEPVSISAVLQSVAEDLLPHARQYDCELQLSLNGKYVPVISNRQALRSAFLSLGYAMIDAQAVPAKSTIILGAHKTAGGLVAGIFADQAKLTADMFRRAQALYGTARQPLVNTSAQAAAGVFIADSLFASLETPLKVAQHHNLSGLAVTLLPSQQLQMV